MNSNKVLWTVAFLLVGIFLFYNAAVNKAGSVYVKVENIKMVNVGQDGEEKWINVNSDEAYDYDLSNLSEDDVIAWELGHKAHPGDYIAALNADPAQTTFRYSFWRTIGVWVAALFTIFILSFLYKDNPLYKFAESVVVGVSAAYWMVVSFWDVIVPNLFGKLFPGMVRNWAMPGIEGHAELIYIIPLMFGVMLLMRLSPSGSWISRWPLALIIGSTAGMRLMAFIHADFLAQTRNAIISLVVYSPGGEFEFWHSILNLILVLGVLASLVYFFFSVEHTGIVGKTARAGIWVLMITFGAAFGYTVMGRIALLAIRLEFLFDDWLWLIDPVSKRIGF